MHASNLRGFIKGPKALKLRAISALLAMLGFTALGYHMPVPGFSSPPQQSATKTPAGSQPRAAKTEPRQPRVDLFGDPLPDEAVARIGSIRMRHNNLIHRLIYSPDGKSLVSGAWGGIRIWDAQTGKLRQRFDFENASVFCADAAFRSDGLLISNGDSDNKKLTIRLLDPAGGKVHWRIDLPKPISSSQPTFSRDGKRIAFSPDRTSVRIYDVATGRETLQLPVSGNIVSNLAFAPKGKTLAIKYDTDTIHLCDTVSSKKLHELKREGDVLSKLVFSPDGRLLASASVPVFGKETEPSAITVWDATTGKERHRLQCFFGLLAFSPDSKTLTILCENGEIVFWDMANGKELRRFPIKEFDKNLAFSPDGKVLAASYWGTIRLLDVATRQVLPVSGDTSLNLVSQLRFSADDKRLIGRADAYRAWEVDSGREIRRFAKIPSGHAQLPLSSDESLLASADKDGTIFLRDARTGKAIRALKGHRKTVGRMIFSPNGQHLISRSEDGTIRIWDVASGRGLHTLTCGGGRTMELTISSDGRWLASAGDSRQVILWDLTAAKEKSRFASAGGAFPDEIAFSPDSRLLAAPGNGYGIVQIRDVSIGKLRHSLDGQKLSAFKIAFSPDSRMLASGDEEGSLFLWELASGRKRHRFVGHESQFYSISFAHDGRKLAASSFDVPAYVWDVAGTIGLPRRPPSDEELRRYWAALAGEDAAMAFQAIRHLAAAPAQTLPFLRQRLKPAPAPNRKRIRQLVEMLDSDDFQKRQNAAEELDHQADTAVETLRQILAKEKPSPEVRRRLQQILDKQEYKPESLRAARVVEVLEWIATADAVRIIDELASGAADARLTREAAAAKRRIER